jgi:hypothetical protein
MSSVGAIVLESDRSVAGSRAGGIARIGELVKNGQKVVIVDEDGRELKDAWKA